LYTTTNGTKNGPAVYSTGTSWTETEITWNTRPARTSNAVDNKDNISAGTWVEYDVTSLVTGNGTFSFVLAADSNDAVHFSSRQGSQPPELVITPSDSVTSTTPTLTSTASANDVIFVGAGDISSCENDNDELTAQLLDTIPGTVFTTGDDVYNEGSFDQFINCYEPTWGRHKARTKPTHDFPMWQVARATAAAPTYFEPFEVAAMTPHGGLVDGGVFANNPAMCAYAEANKLHGRANDFLIVSLGTGQYSSPIHYRDAKGWGLALWAKPILNVVFDGVSDTVDHQMQSLCPPGPDGRPRYYRFQCRLDPRCDIMDDASPENVRRLKEKAEAMIDESEDDLATLCNQLAERAPLPA